MSTMRQQTNAHHKEAPDVEEDTLGLCSSVLWGWACVKTLAESEQASKRVLPHCLHSKRCSLLARNDIKVTSR